MARKKGEGKVPGSGRKKGTLNKRTLIQKACEEADTDPFLFLAEVVSGKRKSSMALRIQAAKELCEYLEPKLSRQELKAEVDNKGGVALIPVLHGSNSEQDWTALYQGTPREPTK